MVTFHRRQCGRLVRAPDLQSSGPGFKSRSDRYLELFHGRPEFNSSATLVNSQLACLLSVGIFSPVMFSLKYLFLIFECSAPLAYCYHHLTRVNKGHLFFILCLVSSLGAKDLISLVTLTDFQSLLFFFQTSSHKQIFKPELNPCCFRCKNCEASQFKLKAWTVLRRSNPCH